MGKQDVLTGEAMVRQRVAGMLGIQVEQVIEVDQLTARIRVRAETLSEAEDIERRACGFPLHWLVTVERGAAKAPTEGEAPR